MGVYPRLNTHSPTLSPARDLHSDIPKIDRAVVALKKDRAWSAFITLQRAASDAWDFAIGDDDLTVELHSHHTAD